MSRDTSKKDELLRLAETYKHSQIYSPKDDCYIEGFSGKPEGVSQYGSLPEPIVDTEPLYFLGTACLTVNRYNALVLNSRDMLIADIDFGDTRLNKFAGASDVDEVIAALDRLDDLDEDLKVPYARFSKESFRVYRTHSGCRVICTSTPYPRDENGYFADRLMLFLKSDRQYMELCEIQGCYRARLTPKPWRWSDGPQHVCELVHVDSDEVVHPALAQQLTLHDDMTLPDGMPYTCLA